MFVYKSEYVFISLLDICILMTMARFKQPLFLKKRPMFLKKHWTFSKIPRDVFFKTTVCFFGAISKRGGGIQQRDAPLSIKVCYLFSRKESSSLRLNWFSPTDKSYLHKKRVIFMLIGRKISALF